MHPVMDVETKLPSILQSESRISLRKSQMKSGWKAKAPVVAATCCRDNRDFHILIIKLEVAV